MNIDQGLFKLDFADHHAVLGMPIDSELKEARKRYLKIARRLHPDSLASASDSEKQQASELLSKLVNPAYETLSQEKSASEHTLVLRLKGQQLSQQPALAQLTLEAAQALMTSNNIDHAYLSAFRALAEKQYDNLDEVLTITGQMSELNLAYLIRKAGTPAAPKSTAKSSAGSTSAPSQASGGPAPAAAPPPPRRYRETILEGYVNRARELEQKQDYPKAIIELREALRAFPNSASCHSQLANVYLKAGQATMARIHANRALEINAGDEIAQQIQKQLEKTTPSPKGRPNSGGDEGGKARGGLFGLFGGKKK